MNIPLQINDTASTMIQVSDPNTISLVYATWALAIVTIIGIVVTAVLTKKSLDITSESLEATKDELIEIRRSNDLTERQLDITQKPNLVITKSKSSMQGREGDYHLKLYYTIKNTGNVPMRKINLWGFSSNNEEIIHIIKEWEEQSANKNLGTIRPEDSLDLQYEMPLKEERKGKNWILCFEYDYLSNKEKTIVIFPNLTVGQEPVPNRIIPNEDILEAKKRLDDERHGNISADF